MDEAEEAKLDRALGTPRSTESDIDDVAATLFTISVTLEEIKDKLTWIAGCVTVLAALAVGYLWRSGHLGF